MAGIDPELQHIGNVGSMKVEFGEYTAGDGTIFVPTHLQNLVFGMAAGEITDPCVGYAHSICEGPTIKFVLSDATPGTIHYMACGW